MPDYQRCLIPQDLGPEETESHFEQRPSLVAPVPSSARPQQLPVGLCEHLRRRSHAFVTVDFVVYPRMRSMVA
jgi:hypothetical protein